VFLRKRARRISCIFEKTRSAKNLPRRYGAFIIGALVIDHDNVASPSFRWDRDRGGGCSGTGTSSSSGGTGTSSSSGGTVAVIGYDSETSSSPTHMCFTLGTSSSPACAVPNSSFIISNVMCKNRNIPK
jgi:hypothetical protein